MDTSDKLAALNRPSPTMQELLDRDPGGAPPELREVSHVDLGTGGISVAAYTDPAFHRAEIEAMWSRVWQMACREEEISEPGDHVLYEIGKKSVIVARGTDGAIRGFHNVCRHRGRRLRDGDGHAEQFRCAYHGFAWDLNGDLARFPSEWDFPQIDKCKFGLKTVRTACWGGFVFVNFDPDACSLQEYLEGLPEMFRRWPLEARYISAYVSKELECNWKIAQEAFIESFHTTDTHPQDAPWIGDEFSQYDTWPDKKHINRMIVPRGLASPSQGTWSEADILRSSEHTIVPQVLPEGSTARHEMARRKRERLTKANGHDYSAVSDAEMIDTVQYLVFPNLVFWWGHGSYICYRFRPVGESADRCLMDVFYLSPIPAGAARPEPARRHFLSDAQRWTDAAELARLGGVFEQDVSNVTAIQKGLSSGVLEEVVLSRYQENRIRHYHRTLGEYLAKGKR